MVKFKSMDKYCRDSLVNQIRLFCPINRDFGEFKNLWSTRSSLEKLETRGWC